ncbi:hypothetical protein BGZ76_003210 [Entomortierella beljakovae]|nr:hypothetical protein BGZ76_003210 [Entomortierella beljakovae]
MTASCPLDLPEIRLRVADFLTHRDLIQCIQVCKSWNDSYLPILWRNVVVPRRPPRLIVTPENIRRYRHLIQALTIEDSNPGRFTTTFPRIQSLSLSGTPISREDLAPGITPDLVALNPSLVHLSLSQFKNKILSRFWSHVGNLPTLKSLSLDRIVIEDERVADAFWRACMNLEELSMTDPRFTESISVSPGLEFNRLTTLKLHLVGQMNEVKQLDFIRRCPELKELGWLVYNIGKTRDAQRLFAEDLGKNLWPNLEMLSFGHYSSDEILAPIIEGMTKVTVLDLSRCSLDTLSFQLLRCRFSTLVNLTLCECHSVTSAMLNEVLCSCPNLKALKGNAVLAMDVVKGGPWASTSIECLCVCFTFTHEEQELQPLVFERISRLTLLKELGVNGWMSQTPRKLRETLDFRLERGMEQLASLKNLTQIDFYRTTQEIGSREVEWILHHWRRLEVIFGRININNDISELLDNRLRDRGIRHD